MKDKMKSTLFLNAISCVDHAFINDSGKVIGGSYHPNFEVSGEVETTENVVIDFGSVKKQLKAAIDHKETGLDHKLWIIPGYSSCMWAIIGDSISVSTEACSLVMPINAVKVFETPFTGCFEETVEIEFSKYLTTRLREIHPALDIEVKTILTSNTFSQTEKYVLFRYSHGLRNSSSWGCQNHSHGHLSFVEFAFKDPSWDGHSGMLFQSVISMNNTIFIFKDNIVEENDEVVVIEYTTGRGRFWARYKKAENKIQVLDTESTIEYISEWYVKNNIDLLKSAGVTRVFVSEGLSKGAVVDL